MLRKKEGFTGERAIVLPDKVVKRITVSPVNELLYITDIGYYPKAAFHYRQRKSGAAQHILIYCVSGKGWCKLQNRSFTIQPNEFLVIPEKMPHTYGADQQDPWTIYWVHFRGSSSGVLAETLLQRVMGAGNGITFNDQRTGLFNKMYSNLEHGYGKHTSGYASILLWHFLGSFLYDDRFSDNLKLPETDVVNTAIQFMRDQLKSKITLEDICKKVCVSVSHFSLLFKQKTGYSPIEYLIHLKIQKACQLLQFSTLRIHEIAQETGIDDPYYFSRLFTNTMGVSPRNYRLSRSSPSAQPGTL